MRNIILQNLGEEPLRIVCLGAHSDDIEIGCAGALFTMFGNRRAVRVHWTVFCAIGKRAEEARAGAAMLLDGAGESKVEVLAFRDGFFPSQAGEIKEHFEDIKAQFSPDLVFTHWERDRHQDHRVISELTWNTFRNHMILEYEVPKYDGDLGNPNFFIPVSDEARGRKLRLLEDVFATQVGKQWFSPETFDGLMRIRGIECASASGYAEGFHCRKVTMAAAPPLAIGHD